MRTPRGPLDNRILLTVLAFLGLQVLYFLCVTVLFGLPVPRLAVFAAVAVGYHAAFYLGLQRVRREFNLESTGEPLRRMNLPLLLSFLRLSSVPAVLFLGWEVLTPFLPGFLKVVSVVHYLGSLEPVPISQGPFALMAQPVPGWLAVVALVAIAGGLVALAAWKTRGHEITYSTE